MRKRGKWLTAETFYSICSKHRETADDCKNCQVGDWSNNFIHFLSGIVFKVHPPLWIWWMNRPGSKASKDPNHINYKGNRNK